MEYTVTNRFAYRLCTYGTTMVDCSEPGHCWHPATAVGALVCCRCGQYFEPVAPLAVRIESVGYGANVKQLAYEGFKPKKAARRLSKARKSKQDLTTKGEKG